MEQDDDADYDRKLSQLRREEELINEEAKEAAAFLQTDIPVIQPGQVGVLATYPEYPTLSFEVWSVTPDWNCGSVVL